MYLSAQPGPVGESGTALWACFSEGRGDFSGILRAGKARLQSWLKMSALSYDIHSSQSEAIHWAPRVCQALW
jgi:hypothetical protein